MKNKDDYGLTSKKELVEQSETNQNGDSSFEFMREQIKNRPVNKRKLLKRTITTAGMAVIFGLVACVTFLLLEPVISNRLNPEDEIVSEITFPEEVEEEEMKLEDMIIEEEPPLEEILDELTPTILEQRVDLEVSDYTNLYSKLYGIAEENKSCIVEITVVKQDTDWMSVSYDSKTTVTGLIVADNGQDLLIVAPGENMKEAQDIVVTFSNNVEYEAHVIQNDSNTGLVALGVEMASIPEYTKEIITYANLGTSNVSSLLGSVVIAIGSPMGNYGSIGYGVITGTGNLVQMTDINYRCFTTDIYCSQSATGIVIDTKGKVLGIISQNYASSDMKNQLCAIGISELKKTIEQLSNGKKMGYAGIKGMDVSNFAHNTYGVPFGAYVKEVEIDSPALESGIQSGDVIIKIEQENVTSFLDYTNAIRRIEEEKTVNVTLMRYSGEEYKEMEVSMTVK